MRLSRFMLSTQAFALTAALFWCIMSVEVDDERLDEVVELLNVLKGPHLCDNWDIFSLAFP